ncbi:MAG TPA: beta-galactosidase, partial [Propionibacteriaceae bacterium]|nr:beta-galactosidase [Propionibacteriaceae bacterium]
MSRWLTWPDGQTRIGYGADYNPEQWDPAVWRQDVVLMREAGVTIVSLGIFSWARIEPSDGTYDFSLFDEVMDLLHENGIAVCLATGTASPPAWLVQKHPEMLPVDADGRTLGFGGRQSWCPSSRTFTSYATRLVRRLAEHYRGHPALVAWHVSNEYGCHNSRCYCDVTAVEFRRWL